MSTVSTATTDEAVDTAVAEARARYVARCPRSAAIQAEAAKVLPGGNTRSVLWFAPFPLRIARGWDSILEDVDGHRYVDFLGEYTAGLFGHSNPVIREAITSVLADGLSFGANNVYEASLAAAITSRFASMELLRFTNSGTEANLMAVALARVATGRDDVLVFRGAYHGGLMSFAKGNAPTNAPYSFVIGQYNDVEGTRRLIDEHGPALAAVLFEPMLGSAGCIPATPEFLSVLRDGATRHGALLIADEVMTSRLSSGGAQARFGLLPDLTTLGKYFGGGLSFGAFGGRRDLMSRFDPSTPDALAHAGTFNNNVLSMAAGHAALTKVLTPAVLDALNQRGDRLRHSLNLTFAAAGAPFSATGIGSLLNVHATDAPVSSPADLAAADDRWKEILFFDLLERGYYMARRGFMALSLAITDAQVDGLIDAVGAVLSDRAALWTRG